MSALPVTTTFSNTRDIMKTLILTVEVKIDDENIVGKYPNFGFNYNLKKNNQPTAQALASFARRQVTTENSMKSFGFSSKITKVSFKEDKGEK